MDVKCYVFVMQEPEKCMEVMKKREEEHLRKTIVQEFLEKYPDARINK